jgi:hypothetical protein
MSLRHLTLRQLNEYKEGIKTEVASGETGLRVIEITDPDTCVKLSKDSGWCVQKHEFAKQYLEKGPLYLIVKDGKRFALISFATSSFMDVYDNPLSQETIKYIFNNSDLGKYAPKGGIYDYINDDNARIDFQNRTVVLSKGKNEKEYKSWFDNGQIYQHCHSKNNELHGDFKQWNENGELIIHLVYENGLIKKRFLDVI